jgi:hypothetical protein
MCAQMYLTEASRRGGRGRKESDHEEVELIFENYLMQAGAILHSHLSLQCCEFFPSSLSTSSILYCISICTRKASDHEEVELIFENYPMQVCHHCIRQVSDSILRKNSGLL